MRANRGIQPTGTGAFEHLYEPPEDDGPPELVDLTYRPDWGHIKGFLESAQALGFDPYDSDILKRAIAAGERAYAAQPVLPKAVFGTRQQHDPLVYYIELGNLIKIGTSTNITNRLSSLNPERVLALEAGGREVEAARHAQFVEARHHGEWFQRTATLTAHAARLRLQFETESGMTVEQWLGRR